MILNMSMAEFEDTFLRIHPRNEAVRRTQTIHKRVYYRLLQNIDHLYSLIRHYVFECDLSLNIGQYYTDLAYVIDEESLKEYTRLKEKYLDNETLIWKNNNIFLEMTQKMQHVYCCTPAKFEVLDDLFKTIDQERTIIFCKYIASGEPAGNISRKQPC